MILPKIGISLTRADVAAYSDVIQHTANGTVPFEDWWTTIQKCKSLEQWKSKLRALGANEPAIGRVQSHSHVGEMLYSHLDTDGSWQAASMQDVRLP